jgi:hypothetical protein
MNINDLNEKLAHLGLSLLVVVVGGLAILVFFFTSMRPSLAMYDHWNRPGMMCSTESFRLSGFVIRDDWGNYWGKSKTWIPGGFANESREAGVLPDYPTYSAPRYNVYAVQRFKHRDEAVNLLFELRSKDVDLRGEVETAPVVGGTFGGHLLPIDRTKKPEGDPFLESDFFIRYAGFEVTLEKDWGRYYADSESRYGGDEYTESSRVGDPVKLFGLLDLHPDLENREIPDDARVYFDFDDVVVTVEWDGDVQATYSCFNAES